MGYDYPKNEDKIFQSLLDNTFRAISTTDRKGERLPSKLDLDRAVRVENAELWQKYAKKSLQIEKKRRKTCAELIKMRGGKALTAGTIELLDGGHHLFDRVNEVYLWHGTTPKKKAEQIYRHGFSLGVEA